MKTFFGLLFKVAQKEKKTLGLVHTSNNLPEWQAVKPTFFAPCQPLLYSFICLQIAALMAQNSSFT